jgi:leucine-rich repeat protein SHOC2
MALARLLRQLAQEASRITDLRLRDNQLTSLPPEVGGLTALTLLDLSENQLTSLPPEIGALTALLELYIRDNQLMSLPPEIGRLTALTSLGLHDNRLTALPPEIGRLTALTGLDLNNNQLATLPPEIGRLTALTSLGLGNNRLTTLPGAIGELTALTELYLHNNQLTSLPPEIGRLTALTFLGLGHNQLTTLPPEIGGVIALRILNMMNNNQLTNLSSEIGELTALTSLYLNDTRLTMLPPEIQQLTALATLQLNNTPLTISHLLAAGWRPRVLLQRFVPQHLVASWTITRVESARLTAAYPTADPRSLAPAEVFTVLYPGRPYRDDYTRCASRHILEWAVTHEPAFDRQPAHPLPFFGRPSTLFPLLDEVRDTDLVGGIRSNVHAVFRRIGERNLVTLQEQAARNPVAFPPSPWPEMPDVRYLATSSALIEEGGLMHHCVSVGYMGQCVAGTAYMYHIGEAAPEGATLQVNAQGYEVQCYGLFNRTATPTERAIVDRWLAQAVADSPR